MSSAVFYEFLMRVATGGGGTMKVEFVWPIARVGEMLQALPLTAVGETWFVTVPGESGSPMLVAVDAIVSVERA